MKTIILLELVILLAIVAGCEKPQSPVPVETPDSASSAGTLADSDTDVAASEVKVAVETEDQITNVKDVGAAQDVSDQVFETAIEPDVEHQDSGTPFLPDICGAGAPSQAADMPCKAIGEIHCTNSGASTEQDLDVASGRFFCFRPNVVRCEAAGNGKSVWKLRANSEVTAPPSECLISEFNYTCAESATSGVSFGKVSWGGGTPDVCSDGETGEQYCGFEERLFECNYYDKLSTGSPPVADSNLADVCLPLFAQIPHWFTAAKCSSKNLTCKDPNNSQPWAFVPTPSKCVGGASSVPHCATTCAELGLTGVAGK